MYSVFEYLYRDAANYKAWGSVLLHGLPSPSDIDLLVGCLEDGAYFVAEQVGIPVLYETLHAVSGGQTEDDHAFHEFVAWQVVTREGEEMLTAWGSVEDLLNAFRVAKHNWNVNLSRHAGCDMGAMSIPA
ncbi:hypothetical protein ACRRRV_06450 [Methylococcus sp. S1B]|uniref:hypothetical protein n=1 Tax=Methylococcus sp. S2T TaxID=3438967 RepID=UPI003E689B8B